MATVTWRTSATRWMLRCFVKPLAFYLAHDVSPPQLPQITEAIGFNSWRMSVDHAPWRNGLHSSVQYHRRTLLTSLRTDNFIRTQRGLFLLVELENQRTLHSRLPCSALPGSSSWVNPTSLTSTCRIPLSSLVPRRLLSLVRLLLSLFRFLFSLPRFHLSLLRLPPTNLFQVLLIRVHVLRPILCQGSRNRLAPSGMETHQPHYPSACFMCVHGV